MPVILRRFCADFALILQICADFAPIFEPKSWSQTNKFDLVFLKLKKRKPLYLLGISDFFYVGCPDGLGKVFVVFIRFQIFSK